MGWNPNWAYGFLSATQSFATSFSVEVKYSSRYDVDFVTKGAMLPI